MPDTPIAASRRRRTDFKSLILLALGVAMTASPAWAGNGEDCELHVWPAHGTGASNGGLLSNLGMAGALADYEQHKDANLRDQAALIDGLSPVIQAQLLAETGLPELVGMPGARIVFESRPLPTGSIRKDKTRRSGVEADCYAELIVAWNVYHKSTLHGRTLTTHFTFKDFRGGRSAAKAISARTRNGVRHFPPERAEDAMLARQGLAEAFEENLRDFVRKIPGQAR